MTLESGLEQVLLPLKEKRKEKKKSHSITFRKLQNSWKQNSAVEIRDFGLDDSR